MELFDLIHAGPVNVCFEYSSYPTGIVALKDCTIRSSKITGRGALSNKEGRFESVEHISIDDGWGHQEPGNDLNKTQVAIDQSKTVISHNSSPDVPFDQSVNPYRGCEHGCVYCYARPTHSYLGLSPGLDFERRLLYKPEVVAQLRSELGAASYRCKVLALGTNTDPYQPIEKKYELTRGILKLLLETRHPVTVTTKSALVERDLDLLQELSADGLAMVSVSVTTLDHDIARKLEPRAAAPQRRLKTLSRLSSAGVPTHISVAPVIPALTEYEIEAIICAGAEAGVKFAGYTLLRLPWEVKELFTEWLAEHYPDRAAHVMSLIRQSRRGKEYDSSFAQRRQGTGLFAELLGKRFKVACGKYGMNKQPMSLNTDLFRRPHAQQTLQF